ncbi:MAG: 30S ribosomal protein S6 [Calditrichaeota bacterium]|nr:30S ribosomal protein S6 [Calditrichota bacterium]RQV93364.1 MAG: 30S ribosomal protein S6 [bacterium]RQW05696.1 MAG: 30S ribosomal protein S6 [Calditrichota bacterium]
MENLYCTIFIVDTSLNPDEAETVSSRIQQLVEDHGGIIRKINRWGKKRLAYPVRNNSHGFYVEIEFTANSRLNIPKIIEAEYRLNDRVLRYLTYIVSKKELIQREKNAGKRAARQEQEEALANKLTVAEPETAPAEEKAETVTAEEEKTVPEKEETEKVPETPSAEHETEQEVKKEESLEESGVEEEPEKSPEEPESGETGEEEKSST